MQYMRFLRRSMGMKEARQVGAALGFGWGWEGFGCCELKHVLPAVVAVQCEGLYAKLNYALVMICIGSNVQELSGASRQPLALTHGSLLPVTLSGQCPVFDHAHPNTNTPTPTPQPQPQLFLRAKRWPRCPWHVYAVAAQMEWRSNREPMVARKIFEKGLESPTLLTQPSYVLAYAEFLVGEL